MIKKLILALFLCVLPKMVMGQTLVGDGVTDNTPIWNALVANVCASNDREVHIGVGEFRFASPMAGIPCSLHVQGEGWGVSVFKCDYSTNSGACYYVVGGMDQYGGGTLRDVSIFVTNGHTIAFGLEVVAHAETDPTAPSHNPHGFFAEHVQIGRDGSGVAPFTGNWNYGVYLDGSANANPPAGVAPYIRAIHMVDIFINAYTVGAAFAYYANASRWINIDCAEQPGAAIFAQYDFGNTFVSGVCPYQHLN